MAGRRWILSIGLLVLTSPAQAQETPELFVFLRPIPDLMVPSGVRSLGMGDVRAPAWGDPTVALHNPAALALHPVQAFQVEISRLAGVERNRFRGVGADADLLLPGLLAISTNWDRSGAAFSYVRRYSFESRLAFLLLPNDLSPPAERETSLDEFSVSFAYRFSKAFSLGLRGRLVQLRDQLLGQTSDHRVFSYRVRDDRGGLAMGFLYEPSQTFSLGVTYQFPVHLESDVIQRSEGPVNRLIIEFPIPAELRVGGAWQLSPHWLLASELQWTGWRTEIRDSVNILDFHLGTEWTPHPAWRLRGGFYSALEPDVSHFVLPQHALGGPSGLLVRSFGDEVFLTGGVAYQREPLTLEFAGRGEPKGSLLARSQLSLGVTWGF